jgi:hypothetical protein
MSYVFTPAHCNEWRSNPRVNPITHRAITPLGPITQQLMRQCRPTSPRGPPSPRQPIKQLPLYLRAAHIPPTHQYTPPVQQYIPPVQQYIPPTQQYTPPVQQYIPPTQPLLPLRALSPRQQARPLSPRLTSPVEELLAQMTRAKNADDYQQLGWDTFAKLTVSPEIKTEINQFIAAFPRTGDPDMLHFLHFEEGYKRAAKAWRAAGRPAGMTELEGLQRDLARAKTHEDYYKFGQDMIEATRVAVDPEERQRIYDLAKQVPKTHSVYPWFAGGVAETMQRWFRSNISLFGETC